MYMLVVAVRDRAVEVELDSQVDAVNALMAGSLHRGISADKAQQDEGLQCLDDT